MRMIHYQYKKIFQRISIAFLVLAVFALIGILLPKKEYHYSIDQELVLLNGETNNLVEEIALPMGTYEFTLHYHTNANSLYAIGVEDGTVFPGGLLSNIMPLYSTLEDSTFRVWLLEGTMGLTFFTRGYTDDLLYADSLTIRATGHFYACLLTLLICIYFVILWILHLKSQDAFGLLQKETKQRIFWIGALTLLLSTPLFIEGMYVIGDINYHLERIQAIADSLQNHVFPLRLQSNFPFGYGYADGIMYGYTLLYIPAIFVLIGFPLTVSFNLFLILVNLATVWISLCCFEKMFDNRLCLGVICSALYSFSIYRITVLYGRGCLGEGCGEIFLPLLLYGYYRLFAMPTKKHSWVILVIAYSGILQTHTLSAELSILWTLLICIIMLRKVFTAPILRQLLVGAAATIVCNLWFLLPFLDYYFNMDLLIKNIGTKTIQFQGIQLSEIPVHFFNGVLEYEDGWPIRAVGPGLLPTLALFFFFVLLIYCRIKKRKLSDNQALNRAVFLLAIFSIVSLILGLRIFPWDKLQMINSLTKTLVSSLLIPTRFLNWTALFMTPVLGYLVYAALLNYENDKKTVLYPVAIALVVLQIASSALYYIDHIASDYEQSVMYENQVVGYVSGGEYLLYGTDESLLGYQSYTAGSDVTVSFYEKKALAADLIVSNASDEYGFVELPLFAYKGYVVTTPSTNQAKSPVLGVGYNNCIRVILPPHFEGELSVHFSSPISWRVAEIISLLGWLFVIVIVLLPDLYQIHIDE